MKYGACCYDTCVHFVDAEAFQRMGLKVFEQDLRGEGFFEQPGFERISEPPAAERFFEMTLEAALEDDLGGFEGLKELVRVFGVAFRDEEFAGRDVEKGQAEGCVVVGEVDSGEEIVACAFEQTVVESYTWRHQFRDAAFGEAFDHFWVFELIADSHAVAGFDELVKI